MKIDVQITGLREARALLEGFSERRLNAAVATALTRTAVEVREVVKARMPSIFDRPNPYTLNSLFVRPARADRLQAEVYFKDETSQSGIAATKYLLPNVEGGARHAKRFERLLQLAGHMPAGHFAVPAAGARLDAYGNVSRGQIIQILSQLRISAEAGFTRNMSFDARKQIAAQRRAGGRFFVVKVGSKRPAPGIYQREFSGRTITPVFLFVNRAQYRARFDFHGIAGRAVDQLLPGHLDRAIAESASRLAARGQP